MIVKFNKKDFIKLAIQNSTTEIHGSTWTKSEEKIILECIQHNLPLEDISKIIIKRSRSAIYTKANSLGYGYKRNDDDGLTYFHTS